MININGRKYKSIKLYNHIIKLANIRKGSNPIWLSGKNHPLYGKKRPDNIKESISKKAKNRFKNPENHPMFGIHRYGKNSPRWKGGITPLTAQIRKSDKYKSWRTSMFNRDNYTCQECYQHGIKLHSHHIKPFSIIFNEFLAFYSQFSPIEDKETLIRLSESYEPFWDLSNGITLCKECHSKIKNVKYKKN